MTTLFSWTGIDTHGPASVYIASDSRISWDSKTIWNVGRKLFASKKNPEIFGYCGSVFFPIQILGQLVDLIDSGLIFSEEESIDTKLTTIRLQIESSYKKLPVSQQGKCQIFYGTRIGVRMGSSFHAARIEVNASNILAEEIKLPDTSGLIASAGSGRAALRTWYEEWMGVPSNDPHHSGRTSRSVFSAFCDSLKSKADPYSGGAPQLVGLYRVGPAINFGVIHENKRFLNGAEIQAVSSLKNVEWRNNLFERCSGETMQILKKAQRQPRLREIKKP